MLKKIILLLTVTVLTSKANAQWLDSYVQQGEFGIAVGAAHYFGDLNTRAALNRPKFAGGIFFRKQINNYIGVKVAGTYAAVGYSDKYSKNETQRRRNLSFNSNIWELTVTGEFNFMKFYPGVEGLNYTPYVGLGIGIFSFDPYAYLGGQKYHLRQIGTEGQGSVAYPGRKPYSSTAMCIPLTLGMKYSISSAVNLFGEIGYRFTTTDYLDDVSTTYAPDAFPTTSTGDPSIGYLLQDRSYETGSMIGIKGRQRGNSSQNDSYVTLLLGVSFNISTYKCPSPNPR
ncbi:hypothetical protein SAMN05421788_1011316 [Filimonas lacunae]|uniref:DUF6089 domain-containing protein n=1 Tax=Filimonas lacunae TaxID=477680 RepID=A0A173MQE3_9BACT|nr:DUF6089 family protein [Filimonas lacunae]BAV09883.1 hypothetical protein FLA_5936 [Filimonas lacunae]SIS80460.1 hypothetical protein SAMN05421788_1011316 [Filimonas lacunae]